MVLPPVRGRGPHRPTDSQTDIATNGLSRPRHRLREKFEGSLIDGYRNVFIYLTTSLQFQHMHEDVLNCSQSARDPACLPATSQYHNMRIPRPSPAPPLTLLTMSQHSIPVFAGPSFWNPPTCTFCGKTSRSSASLPTHTHIGHVRGEETATE